MDKIYQTFKTGQHQGTYSIFEEALWQARDWDMPVIKCEAEGEPWFRVEKHGINWTQIYEDGRERDVTAKVKRLISEGARKPGRQ